MNLRVPLALVAAAVLRLATAPARGNDTPDAWLRHANEQAATDFGPGFGPAADVLPGLPPNPNTSFDDAFRLVVSRVLDGDAHPLQLSARKSPLSAADAPLATWAHREVIPPWNDYWFFFADDDPLANWAHPCRYIFVARDLSAIAIQRARTPPLLPLEILIPFVPPPAPMAVIPARAPPTRSSSPKGSTSNAYAVLISGGCNTNNNATRFWGDCAALYSTLTLSCGYPKTNVFPFISDGTNPAVDAVDVYSSSYVDSPTDLDGDGSPDTLGEASAANVSNLFLHLQSILRPTDQLLVFVTDHGNHTSGGAERDSELNLWNNEVFRDADLEALTAPLPCPVLFVMEQCYSGGFLDNLGQPQRAIATAASHDTTSSGGDLVAYFDQWCYEWIAAMRGFYPATNAPWQNAAPCVADFNGDGLVSFREASCYANAHAPAGDAPQYADSPSHFGSRIFLLPPTNPIPNLTDYLEIAPFRIPPATNIPFLVTLTARDPLGAIATNFSGPVSLETIADIVNPGLTVGQPVTDYTFLLRTASRTVRTQVIYPATMMDGPRSLDQLSLRVASPPTQTLQRFTIRLRHTDLETYPAYPTPVVWETDWDTMCQTNLDIPTNGWVTIPFSHPFAYDGTRHLMADFSFSNDFATEDATLTIFYDDVTHYRAIHRALNGEFGDPLDWSSTNPPSSRAFMFPLTHFGPLPYEPRVAISPTHLTDFTNGVWSGTLTASNAANNVRILFRTTNDYWDTETPRFPILDYLFDLATPRHLPDGSPVFDWGSGTGCSYRIMCATHLPDGFIPLATNLPATPPLNSFTAAPDSSPSTFFRIEEE